MSEIRVRNATGAALDDVRITPPGGRLSMGPLASGAVSSWHPVGAVHRYPAVEASGPGIDLMHLPFDGDAQADLPAGRYTYVLRLEGGRLVVGLEED
jgi:hypothetical protein